VNSALWFLTWLRFRGVLRRFGRSLRTAKGILLGVAGLIVCLSCLTSWLLSLIIIPVQPDSFLSLETIRRYGPFGLLAMSLLPLLSSTAERSVVPFNPAEVNFLFAGPFTRRQLLGNKLLFGFLTSAVMAFFFVAGFASFQLPNVPLLARFTGMVLALWFLQLFTIALGFLANTIGLHFYNRGRKLLLGLLAVAALIMLYRTGAEVFRLSPRALLEGIEQTPGLQAALQPLYWLVRTLTAERLWPDLVQWGSLSLLFDLGLLALVFALDAHYLETAAVASERIYAQVQRLRRGGGAAAMMRRSGHAPFHWPSLPWLGGMGPVAWRQLSAVPRSRVSLILLGMLVMFVTLAVIAGRDADRAGTHLPLFMGIHLIIVMTLFVTPLVTYDFRGDVDRMDVLKTLPIRGLPLVAGQLVTPVLLFCIIHAFTLAALAVAASRREIVLGALAALAFIVPLNFLLFAVDNLLFLIFPLRGLGTPLGDLQAIGRQVLLTLAKVLVLTAAWLLAGFLAVPIYFLAGDSIMAALATAWIVFTGLAIGSLPVLGLAFQNYDVARDTPP
jgi:hypothetical protein